MKVILVAFVLFLLAGSVSALSISATTPITQGTQWAFTVDFSGISSADEAKVFVDGSEVMTVFDHSNKLFVDEATVSSKVVSYSIDGEKIVISYTGLKQGSYDISAKLYTGSSVTDEDSFSLEVLTPLSQSERDVLQGNINSMQITVDSLEAQSSSLQSEVTSLQNINTLKDTEISNLKIQNSSLSQTIDILEAEMDVLKKNGQESGVVLSQVKSDLNDLVTENEEAKKSNVFTGMLALGSNNSLILLGVLAIIVVVAVALFLNSKDGSIYSKKPSFFSKFSRTKSANGEKKSKWLFREKGFSPEKDDSKKYSLGDLVKK